MTCDLPLSVQEHMRGVCIENRRPAYLLISEECLVQQGGDCAHYGLDDLRTDTNVVERMPFVEGTLPLQSESLLLPLLCLGGDRYAEVHILPSQEGDWILLLDATETARKQARIQQNTNELSLLRARQALMLEEIHRSNSNLLAILDRLQLITAIVDERGLVEFLSRKGHEVLGRSPDDAAGLHWRDLLSLSPSQADQIEAMIARPATARERVRLTVHLGKGRPRWFDIDIQDDPREQSKKIMYIYDMSEIHDLRDLLNEKASFYDLVGKSSSMQRVFQLIKDVSGVDSTVLIEGETGTGKELTARAIHSLSQRKDGPFVVINCAGLSDSLINSQLFGHKKGAFTDAVRDQEGLFEAADGGTILLDEIGDIPMNTQTRILRVLEQREITRIGETRQRKINIRILAATNKRLEDEVKKGNFRLDLLYRIRVARVQLPPLRERREDIPLLTEFFMRELCAQTGKKISDIENQTLRMLTDHHWPGNVRELKNALEFAIIRCRTSALQVKDLPPEITEIRTRSSGARPYETDSERTRIIEALEATNGKRLEAAALLGISRATLYRRMKACFLDPADF